MVRILLYELSDLKMYLPKQEISGIRGEIVN